MTAGNVLDLHGSNLSAWLSPVIAVVARDVFPEIRDRSTEQSIVLLKNTDGQLPLSPRVKTIAVIGSHGDVWCSLGRWLGAGPSNGRQRGAPARRYAVLRKGGLASLRAADRDSRQSATCRCRCAVRRRNGSGRRDVWRKRPTWPSCSSTASDLRQRPPEPIAAGQPRRVSECSGRC